jgi:riboflavin biosynthesis pyrimidine reductase
VAAGAATRAAATTVVAGEAPLPAAVAAGAAARAAATIVVAGEAPLPAAVAAGAAARAAATIVVAGEAPLPAAVAADAAARAAATIVVAGEAPLPAAVAAGAAARAAAAIVVAGGTTVAVAATAGVAAPAAATAIGTEAEGGAAGSFTPAGRSADRAGSLSSATLREHDAIAVVHRMVRLAATESTAGTPTASAWPARGRRSRSARTLSSVDRRLRRPGALPRPRPVLSPPVPCLPCAPVPRRLKLGPSPATSLAAHDVTGTGSGNGRVAAPSMSIGCCGLGEPVARDAAITDAQDRGSSCIPADPGQSCEELASEVTTCPVRPSLPDLAVK